MEQNKLFTKEAVNTALGLCVLGSLNLADPKKLAEDLSSLPKDLSTMVIASIMAGRITLKVSKVGNNLEQEVLKAIKESQENEENNSKTN